MPTYLKVRQLHPKSIANLRIKIWFPNKVCLLLIFRSGRMSLPTISSVSCSQEVGRELSLCWVCMCSSIMGGPEDKTQNSLWYQGEHSKNLIHWNLFYKHIITEDQSSVNHVGSDYLVWPWYCSFLRCTMHKCVYTSLQLSIGSYVFSWPITSVDLYPWGRRKSQTILPSFREKVISLKPKLWLANSIMTSWVLTFHSLHSWKWWRNAIPGCASVFSPW